jgi:uncharacterized protein with PQ loop repeat
MSTRSVRQQTKQRQFINKAILVVAAIEPLSTIPQVITVFSHRSAAGVSVTSWVLFVIFDVIWAWYGLSEKQTAIIISGVMFGILEAAVVVGALLYGGSLW